MAVMPVPKLILNMGFPMMLSMLGQALYNVVDTFYVSRIPDSPGVTNAGEMAINALTLAFPVQMLIMALGVGTGVGVNALVSRLLGMKQRRQAENAAGNALFVTLLYFLAMFLFGIFGAEAFIGSQTDNSIIASYGTTYVRIISTFSFGTLGYMCLEKVTIATGRTKITMMTQIAGALTNILLDPILIYGWIGFPAMGVRGAAIATVVGQFVSLIWIGSFYLGKKRILSVRRADFRPRKQILAELYRIGIPAIAMQILVPIMSYVMNLILGSISEAAVTAYGIYYKLQNFIFMPGYGLNNASIPIISFNFGAGKKERIAQAVRWALTDVTVIMLIGVILLEGWTKPIVSLFAVTSETESLCVAALRIIVWGFFFAGVNIILQGVCQALGNGFFSLIISLVRLIAVPLPSAFFLARLPQASSVVWFSIPMGELSACVIAVILTMYLYRRKTGKL
ncbi:MAG: MATE family efflux transporter [Bilifractor sp.]